MTANESPPKNIVDLWKDETAHLSPEARKRVFETLMKMNAARRARLARAAAAARTTGED